MSENYSQNLANFGEVGYVEKVWQTIAEVEGLPSVKSGEIVMIETGQVGQATG